MGSQRESYLYQGNSKKSEGPCDISRKLKIVCLAKMTRTNSLELAARHTVLRPLAAMKQHRHKGREKVDEEQSDQRPTKNIEKANGLWSGLHSAGLRGKQASVEVGPRFRHAEGPFNALQRRKVGVFPRLETLMKLYCSICTSQELCQRLA